MIDTSLFIICLGLLACITIVWQIIWHKIQAKKDDEMALAVQMVLDHAFVLMEIKEVEGKLMAYRTKTNEYIAQGKTFKELSKNFLERFPEKTGLFPGTDLRIEAKIDVL